nr:pneumococcal serine-rich repeat protein isoform X2 [Scatophagus argus]
MKLQLQKMHLGPPPLVLPVRRPEDLESRSEDDGLPHSPPEISGGDITTQGALRKTISQSFSHPLSPIPKPAPAKSAVQTPPNPLPLSVPSNSSVVEGPLDFSSPAQFTPCLDTSAARHRMLVKPRNQRASTKRRLTATDSRSNLHTTNNVDHPESVKEVCSTQEEATLETEEGGAAIPIISQCVPSKVPEVVPITPEAISTSSSLTSSQQDQAIPESIPPVPPQVLRVKPHRPADVMSSERPHSSYIPSELKDKREGGFETPVMSYNRRNTLKAGMTEVSSNQLSTAFGSAAAFKSSSVHQQVEDETESTRGIKRSTPGSGTFHFSITAAKNRDGERPRSGSFAGVLEQIEAKQRMEDKPFSSMKEKAELRDLQPRGRPFTMGMQEGTPQRSSVPPDRRDSLKKVELVTPSKNVTTDTGVAEMEEVESSQEVVEEAVEAKEVEEDEGKTTFGIKLRSTSQSIRVRSDASSNQQSKSVCEEQCDKQKRHDISDNGSYMSKKLSTNTSCTSTTSGELRLPDPAKPGFSLPVKHNLPSTCDPHIMATELQTKRSPKDAETANPAPQEPQPAPQTTPSEVSWMSLAMEKTRSIQQLFTSRFPRDFTGVQAVARPQAQVPTQNQTEIPAGAQMQTQTVKIQQSTTTLEAANHLSTDAVKTETVQSRSQAQTVKASLISVQQKTSMTSPAQSNTSREPQTSKQTNEPQSHPNITASQSESGQSQIQTTQSPVHSSAQTETPSQFAQESVTQSLAQSYLSSGQKPRPWSSRGPHPASQLKSTTSATASVSTTSSASVSTTSSASVSTISSASVSTISSATAPPPVLAMGREEGETTIEEKESTSLPGRRAFWAGSVSEKAAFLEKRAEWTTPPGTKGVGVKKAQTEVQTSGETPASATSITPLSKDTKPEGRQGAKPAESTPIKVPERPCEDKWLRKNVPSSSSPSSSSPTIPSALEPMSDSGQPSWMELAKRKSMAWSDKSMD